MPAIASLTSLLTVLPITSGYASPPRAGIGSTPLQWRNSYGRLRHYSNFICQGNLLCYGPTVANNNLGLIPKYFGVVFHQGKDSQYSEIFAPHTSENQVIRTVESTFPTRVLFDPPVVHHQGGASCAWFLGKSAARLNESGRSDIGFVVEMYSYFPSVGFKFLSTNVQITHIYNVHTIGASC